VAEVTLSSKNQIVVPREAREALGLKAGSKLHVVVRGDVAILLRRPRSHADALAGIARGTYPADYLEAERSDW
jgi:AbrB family looped-hinge helix DNA binding protein